MKKNMLQNSGQQFSRGRRADAHAGEVQIEIERRVQ